MNSTLSAAEAAFEAAGMANAEAAAPQRMRGFRANKLSVVSGGSQFEPVKRGRDPRTAFMEWRLHKKWENVSRVTPKAMRSEAFCASKEGRNFWTSTSSSI